MGFDKKNYVRSKTARSWDASTPVKPAASPRRKTAVGDAVMSDEWAESHADPIMNFGPEEDAEPTHLALVQETLTQLEERLQTALSAPLAFVGNFKRLKN